MVPRVAGARGPLARRAQPSPQIVDGGLDRMELSFQRRALVGEIADVGSRQRPRRIRQRDLQALGDAPDTTHEIAECGQLFARAGRGRIRRRNPPVRDVDEVQQALRGDMARHGGRLPTWHLNLHVHHRHGPQHDLRPSTRLPPAPARAGRRRRNGRLIPGSTRFRGPPLPGAAAARLEASGRMASRETRAGTPHGGFF